MAVKSTLLTQVKRHTTSQATNGQATLALTLATLDHMFGKSGDWSPLAYLIGKSQPAQSRVIRLIIGQIIQGWSAKADKKQVSGIRFTKKDGQNQGIDDKMHKVLTALVEQKKPILGQDVKAAFTSDTVAKSAEDLLDARIKSDVALWKKLGIKPEVFVGRLAAALKEAQAA
jgi:hypothetical protein